MEEIVKSLALQKDLDSLRPIDMETENRMMQKFRIDWNYHSNHLEGNLLSYGETKALLLFGITTQGKPLKDHFEITGHNEGINYALDMIKENRPLTEHFIRELHVFLLVKPYQIVAQTPEGLTTKKWIAIGKYKTAPNHVETQTGEIFHFASPEETPAKMNDLLNWYQKKIKDSNANPILIAAEFHYKFILIHPFDDGNGRTARIVMNFILMKFGFPPVIIKTEDKINYFAALQLADAGNIEPFMEYIAVNLNRSLSIMIAGAKGENIEEEDDLDKEIALLEQKVSAFGWDKLNNILSVESVNDIYENTILKLGNEISDKIKKINIDYFRKISFINGPSGQLPLPYAKDKDFQNIPSNIFLSISLEKIKKRGLENFNFNMDILFEFKDLNYIIYDNGLDFGRNIIFTKNYINLTDEERLFVVKLILKRHNQELTKFIEQAN